MPTLNATVYPDEAYVLVEVDWLSASLRDTFERVSASGWGTPDVGPAWTIVSGVAADFTVNGDSGIFTHSAVGTSRNVSSALGLVNFDYSGTYTSTTVPTGANPEIHFQARYVDGNNMVDARLFLQTSGTVTAAIRQRIGGVETSSGFPAVPISTSGTYHWRFQGVGSFLGFRVWAVGTPEPTTWNVIFTTTWLTAGSIGLRTEVPGGVTNPPPIAFTFDNIVVFDPTAIVPQYATVTRRNTVTGEVVTLRPYISYDSNGNLLLDCGMGLWWDTEPPLNVPLEYCAVASDTPVTLSQNPDFETTTAPWTATNGTLAQNCSVAKVGACSGQLTPTGGLLNPAVSQTLVTLPVTESEATLSAWARTAQGWNSVFLRAVITYTDLTVDTFTGPLVTLDDTEWRLLTLSFTPSKTVSSVVVSFVAAGFPPNTTLFQLDDFKLTQLQTLTATDCETVTVTSESVWLKNPLHPCLDVEVGLCDLMYDECGEGDRVTYVGHDGDEYSANTVLLTPENRRRPIAVNRVRRDAVSTVRVLAHTCVARDAVLDANEPGDPLLFQAPAEYCIADRYISVGTLTDSRISVDQREPFRLMSLPYAVVDRPEGPADGVCGARIMDLCDIYSSWGALTIAGLTWLDLLLGEASPDGPGQPEPPADARTWDDVEAEFTDWDDVEAGGTRTWDDLKAGL